jgi:DNA polymerase III alpha subunit
MFFFSAGSLTQIYNRGSYFQQSTMTSSNNSTIRSSDPRPLVYISDIMIKKNDDGEKMIAIKLNDSENELLSLLDKSQWFKLEEKCNQMLKIGSVITINSFSFINFRIENESVRHVLSITDLSLIGHYQNQIEETIKDNQEIEKLTKSTSAQLILDESSSHTINELAPRLSSANWSIKVKVTNKSPIREFTNRQNGNNGKTMRLQLRDHTGQIEMVVFNDLCERFDELQLNRTYLFRNGEIKFSKASCRAWPNELCVIYDLIATKQTEFSNIKEADDMKFPESVRCHQKIESPLASKKYQKFTPLNELILKSANSYVDVIGVITEISELKSITKKNKTTLLRNFKILDSTNVPVNVAIWGDEAQHFSKTVDSIIVLNNVQLTNYGGISLSVLRASNMIEMQISGSSCTLVKELSEWYDKEYKIDLNKQNDKEEYEEQQGNKRKRL